MSGSIGININVDAGNASAVFNQVSQQIQQIANSAASLTGNFASLTSAANSASSALNNVGQQTQNVGRGFNTAHVASSGFLRELIVIGHEAMSGRLNRIPGSLMVLSEYMGRASIATMGLVGAFALAAVGAAHLVEWLNRINQAKAAGEAAAATFNPGFDQSKVDAMVMGLRKYADITTEDAGKIAQVYAGMRSTTQQQMQAMADVTDTYAKATGQSLDAAARSIRAMFEDPSTKGREFIQSLADGTSTLKVFDAQTGNTGPANQRKIILQALADAQERVAETAHNGDKALAEDTDWDPHNTLGHLEQQRKDVAAAMANISNEPDQSGSSAQVTWFEKQQEGADELRAKIIGMATNYKTANEQAEAALAEYWKHVESMAVQGSKAQLQAHEEYLRAKEAADMANLRISSGATKNEFDTQLAALNMQQAAAANNKDQVMAIEQQKLALFQQYSRTNTAAYENELRKQVELKQHYAQQEVQAEEDKVKQEQKVNAATYSETSKQLSVEVAAHQLSNQERISQLQTLAQTQEQSELTTLDAMIATLTAGTSAWRKAMDDRAQIVQQYNSRVAALDAQLESQQAASAGNQYKTFASAFDSIGSSWMGTVRGLIDRTTTWQKAEYQAADAVISSFAEAGLKMVGQWVASMIAMETSNETKNAVIAAQNAGDTGFGVLLSRTLGQFLGFKTQQTAINQAQNTVQTAGTTASQAAQTAATTTGQAAQVGAVVAGGQAKVAAQTAAAAEGKAAQAAVQGPSIMADAAKAAAGAYASVSSIPLVGWLLAPAAGAAAFAAVAAYEGLASFDVGTDRVPADMIAQIHKDEMIIPATQANTIRATMNKGFNIPGFSANIPRAGSGFTSSNLVNQRGGDVVQNFTFNGAPGAFGSQATSLLSRAKRDAMSMAWELGRNGSLRPRQI